MSFKDNLRKSIIAITAAAVATSFFTGCSDDKTPSDEDLYGPDISTPIESTPSSDVVIDKTTSEPTTSENETSDTTSENETSDTTSDIEDTSSSVEESTPEPITSSTTDTKPVESKPVQSTAPVSSSKPVQSTPVQSSKPAQSTQETFVTGDNKPTSSSTPASSSTPTQSTPTPSTGGNVYEPGKYTGYTPSDTTGFELDSDGHPANINAWTKATGTRSFVDSTGQLWNYRRGTGWQKAAPGTITDGTGVDPSKGYIVGD